MFLSGTRKRVCSWVAPGKESVPEWHQGKSLFLSGFMQNNICIVHACLAVTCHLHFWQNDQDLLRATAITRGLNRHRNNTYHQSTKNNSTTNTRTPYPTLIGTQLHQEPSQTFCHTASRITGIRERTKLILHTSK